MEITRLQPAGLVVSPAFSHVAVVPAGATTIYVGGQNGVDDTGAVVSADVAEQSARALDNVSTALEAAGATLADVIQWTVLIAQDADLDAAYGAIAPRLGGSGRPAARHRRPGRRARRAGRAHRGQRDRRGAARLTGGGPVRPQRQRMSLPSHPCHNPPMRYSFGDVVLDTDRFLLERGGQPLHVQPQVFDVLSHLVGEPLAGRPQDGAARHRLGRPLRQRVDVDQPDQGRPAGAWATTASASTSSRPSTAAATLGGRRRGPGPTAGGRHRPRPGPRPPRRLEQRIRFCRTSGRCAARLRDRGRGPPAGAGGALDHAPRLRVGQPRLAALDGGPVPRAHPRAVRRARVRAVRPRPLRRVRWSRSCTTSRRWSTTWGSSGSR